MAKIPDNEPRDVDTSGTQQDKVPPARTRSQLLVNSANIINNADSQLFPSMYAQIQSSLGLSLEQVTLITTARSLLQAISTPLWGWWSDRHNRKIVLAFGCFLWAFFTILMAYTVSYVDILIYRLIIGIGLAVIIPTAQSILSDLFPPKKRGKVFGILGLTGIMGIVFGTLFATAVVGSGDYIDGLPSWKFVFIVWGGISIIIGIFILTFVQEPIRGQMEPELKGMISRQINLKHKMKLRDYLKILSNRTFLLIIAQGVIGSIPWNGIFLMILWFEYVGFDSFTAGIIFAIIALGAAVGNIIGGYIGDYAAKKSPKRGRIIIAQICAFSGIPLSYIIFFVIPASTSSMLLYIVFGILTGLLTQWCSPGCNQPIFSEIFEPEMRSSVFSVDAALEGSIGATGTLLVGIVADKFGFISPGKGQTISQLSSSVRHTNMVALGHGIFLVAFIPWVICLIIYSFIYLTYWKDHQKMRQYLEERSKKDAEEISENAEERK